MKKAIIVASMKSNFPLNEGTYFGVDRGALYLAQHGVYMEESIGDFDSVSKEEMMLIEQYSKKMSSLNCVKDETDLEVALKRISEYPYVDITVYGALGGRIDHQYANLILLNRYADQVNIRLVDENHEIKVLSTLTEYLVTQTNFKYHSFFALEDAIISLKGFKYELDHYELKTNDIKGISNEIIIHVAKLILERGRVLYIQSNDLT